MTAMTFVLLLFGMLLLILGAELLVRGASRLAAIVGLSPLVIGLTVVAFGTSSPELAVSIQSAMSGKPEIALGNVVGSNIFNVLLILGLSAAIVPLVISKQLVKWDVPIMIAVSLIALLMAMNGKVSRLEGILLVFGILAYTTVLIILGRENAPTEQDLKSSSELGNNRHRAGLISFGLVIAGLALLVLGSRWLVRSSTEIAHAMGVSELVIGLTIIAAGTSLPEVATSVMASVRGQRDIAVGNVIGSNIFNLLAVLGISSVVAPDGMPVSSAARHFDIPVMLAVAIACLPIFFTGNLIARWEGGVFLAYYIAYTVYLILDSMHHDMLGAFSTMMTLFVLPLTALTLVVVTVRALRKGTRNREVKTEHQGD